jgi:hypothetical protein
MATPTPRPRRGEPEFVVSKPGQTDYLIVEGKRLSSWADESRQAFLSRIRVHVRMQHGGWSVGFEGLKPLAVKPTQAEAILAARERALAHDTWVVIHLRDGNTRTLKPKHI